MAESKPGRITWRVRHIAVKKGDDWPTADLIGAELTGAVLSIVMGNDMIGIDLTEPDLPKEWQYVANIIKGATIVSYNSWVVLLNYILRL